MQQVYSETDTIRMQQVYSESDTIRMQQVYSESENQIQLERSRSTRNQRMMLYSCHCKALRAHLEMRCSTNVHTTRPADKTGNEGCINEDQTEVSFGLFYFFSLFCAFALCKKAASVEKLWLTSMLLPFGSSLQFPRRATDGSEKPGPTCMISKRLPFIAPTF